MRELAKRIGRALWRRASPVSKARLRRVWKARLPILAVGAALVVGWVVAASEVLRSENFGAIYVESPEIYTRERLVNDRYRQDAWLEKQLEKLDVATNLLQGTITRAQSFGISGGVGGDAPATQPATPAADANQIPAAITFPFDLEFKVRAGIRDGIRQAILENQLDDRHDLGGNSIYVLKFDATVVPGSGSHQRAMIRITADTPRPGLLYERSPAGDPTKPLPFFDAYYRVKAVTDHLVSAREQPDKPDNLPIVTDEEVATVRGIEALFDRWIASVQLRVNKYSEFYTRAFIDCKLDATAYQQFARYVVPDPEKPGEFDFAELIKPQSCKNYIKPILQEKADRPSIVQDLRSIFLSTEKPTGGNYFDVAPPSLPLVDPAPPPDTAMVPPVSSEAASAPPAPSDEAAAQDEPSSPTVEETRARTQVQGMNEANQQASGDGQLDYVPVSLTPGRALRLSALIKKFSAVEVISSVLSIPRNKVQQFELPGNQIQLGLETHRRYFTVIFNATDPLDAPITIQRSVDAPFLLRDCHDNAEIRRQMSAWPAVFDQFYVSDDFVSNLPSERIPVIDQTSINWIDVIEGRYVGYRGVILVSDGIDLAYSRPVTEISADLLSLAAKWKQLHRIFSASGATCPALTTSIPSGLFNFVRDITTPDRYSYAVLPREESRAYLNDASVALTAMLSAQGPAGTGGVQAFGESLSQVREALAETTVVGFAGLGSDDSWMPRNNAPIALAGQFATTNGTDSEMVFGWILSPPPGRSGGAGTPVQRALSALISVPAWQNALDLTIETGWLDARGSFRQSNGQKSIQLRVPLPQDLTALDAVLGDKGVAREPSILTTQMDRYRLAPCRPATIVIPGLRLWRSTRVTLGAQRADQIEVLPSMDGLIAYFDEIQPAVITQEGGNVPLRVWTSEGTDVVEDKITILPPEDVRDCKLSEAKYNRLIRAVDLDDLTGAASKKPGAEVDVDKGTTAQ